MGEKKEMVENEEGRDYSFVRAARDGKVEEVDRLLSCGVDVNVCLENSEENTKTALYVACKHGRTEIVEKLLNRDADWKIRRKGVSPLLIAAKYGNLAIVRKLLDRGVPIETCDDLLRTALHYAAWGGRACARAGASAEVAQWLVEEKGMKEGERDALGFTPMCYAAESDNLEVLKFLEKRRGGLEEKRGKKRGEKKEEKQEEKKEEDSEDGPSLLSLAARGEAVGVIRYLSERGMKIEEKETLHNAARYHPRIVEELVGVGLVDKERANERDEDGNTPLHLIFSEMEFSEEMLRSVRALVRAGADINAKDELDKTVITKWVGGAKYDSEMLERGLGELQKLGGDVNEGGALHMCVEAKEIDLFCTLLRKFGADVNARYEGQTVLHMVVSEERGEGEEGNERLVELLVREGANLNAKDDEGHTPAYLAKKGGNKTLYNKLVKLGAEPVEV